VRDPSLHVLQHALGLDDYGQGRYDKKQTAFDSYRNRYITEPECDGWDLRMAHVEAGRMVRHEPREIFGGPTSYCFCVTDAGKAFVISNSQKPPKVSRGRRRYLEWLEVSAAYDISFGEWLRRGCTLEDRHV